MEIAFEASSSQRPSNALASLSGNFETFLTLLTTQLRNQDPLSPLDTEKFTSQLVQFASVEQSISTNRNLEALIALQNGSGRESALGYVGKTISIADAGARHDGEGASWTYVLPRASAETQLQIIGADGAVVASLPGASAQGAHDVRWNGVADDGKRSAPGFYRLVVDALDADGRIVPATIETSTHVTGVRFGPGGPTLETALGPIAIDAVRRVSMKQEG